MEQMKPLGQVLGIAGIAITAAFAAFVLLLILIPVLIVLRKRAKQAERENQTKKAVPRWILVAVLSIVCVLLALFSLPILYEWI